MKYATNFLLYIIFLFNLIIIIRLSSLLKIGKLIKHLTYLSHKVKAFYYTFKSRITILTIEIIYYQFKIIFLKCCFCIILKFLQKTIKMNMNITSTNLKKFLILI